MGVIFLFSDKGIFFGGPGPELDGSAGEIFSVLI